jgi:hypothetical protein
MVAQVAIRLLWGESESGQCFKRALNPASYMRAHGACLTRSRTTQSSNPCLCYTTERPRTQRAHQAPSICVGWVLCGGMVAWLDSHGRKLPPCLPHYCQTPRQRTTSSQLATLPNCSATAGVRHYLAPNSRYSSRWSLTRKQVDLRYHVPRSGC